ncbi:MAG: hypothetical protein SFV32_04675 [Opitutaceae bacterium]|nr:hypothetical protein [Opitutaceae bacterium]
MATTSMDALFVETINSVAATINEVNALMEEFQALSGRLDLSVKEQVTAAESISSSIMAVSQMSEEVAERIAQSRHAGEDQRRVEVSAKLD